MDYNNEFEKKYDEGFNDGFRKGYEDAENLYLIYLRIAIRWKKRLRQKLSNMLIGTTLLCGILYFCRCIIERLEVLPTEPYRDLNIGDYIMMIAFCLCTIFGSWAYESSKKL